MELNVGVGKARTQPANTVVNEAGAMRNRARRDLLLLHTYHTRCAPRRWDAEQKNNSGEKFFSLLSLARSLAAVTFECDDAAMLRKRAWTWAAGSSNSWKTS